MDWKNIDLKDGYERSQPIVDALSFDTLLLEISCNLKVINKITVRSQFELDLQSRINSAREVFADNLENIVKEALEYRNSD